jgi:hypothetical protein
VSLWSEISGTLELHGLGREIPTFLSKVVYYHSGKEGGDDNRPVGNVRGRPGAQRSICD